VLDAMPQYVIPARVAHVAAEAQFTPKTVETASERQKLVFQVKLQLDQALLRQHASLVKSGLPGVATIRLDQQLAWPPQLQTRLPPP
jgi:HlyD family secretion protein